ncbi:hypothetical protein HZH66_013076 [Vespula vulgaris]|uniref:Protein transport protein Sec61 subunit gamma n=1 Tax=Vespula vulgaris TaxID=7454 RepID=A0A834J6I3_VESVU|nr:hypothetical protein HZH66_013076 [Vespula vulgaris]
MGAGRRRDGTKAKTPLHDIQINALVIILAIVLLDVKYDTLYNVLCSCTTNLIIMDQVKKLTEPGRQFAKDSIRLVKRCTKPDRKEFQKIAIATAIGFCIMGFIGFFVKLIHIPINNIIVNLFRTLLHLLEMIKLNFEHWQCSKIKAHVLTSTTRTGAKSITEITLMYEHLCI